MNALPKEFDELSDILSDWSEGPLEDDRISRLDEILAKDEAARRYYTEYVDLCVTLRRQHGSLSTDLDETPLAERAAREPQRNTRRFPTHWIAVAVAACLFIGVALYQAGVFEQQPPREIDFPSIVAFSGEASVTLSDGTTHDPSVGRMIRSGDRLQLANEDDEIILRYSDGTEIGLSGIASMTIAEAASAGKRLQLDNGLLHADVAKQPTGQPLVIATLHANVRVLGTRFDLTTDDQQGTRLELESGNVELVRGEESPVAVQPSQIALVPVTTEPIQIIPRPTVVETPDREMKLRKVSSIEYAVDGKTIVGFGEIHAVYWFDDDRLEAAPVLNKKSGRLRFQGQSGPFIAFEDLSNDRLTIWNTEDRRPAYIFDDFARLPRFFTQSRDRNNEFVLPGRKRLISPQGDWAAFEYYGGGFMVWHCESDEWRDLEYKGRANAITASPDGRLMALGHWRGRSIDIFDVRERKLVAKWNSPKEKSPAPTALSFSADAQRLIVAVPGQVRIFDVATGELIRSTEQPGVKFTSVAMSPDGRWLAASSDDRQIRLWDMNSDGKQPTCSFQAKVRHLKFAPNSRELAGLGRHGRAMIWEIPPRETVAKE